MEKLQDIELKIKNEQDGVFAISLVEFPAIEEKWVALSSETIELKVVDEEQRIVIGYALVPNKRIYRKVKDKEFNIYFSEDTVKQASELYMKQLNLNNVTADHERKVYGASVIESWITEDKKHDKVNLYGIEPIMGGWVVKMKIYNDEEWQAVKKGEYKGFSIEGKFDGFEKLKQNKMENNLVEEIKALINAELKSEKVELAASFADVKTQLQRAETSHKEVLDFANKLYALKNEAKKIVPKAIENLNKIQRELKNDNDDFIKRVKELGIDVSKLPQPKSYQSAIEKVSELEKRAIQMYNDLK